MEGRLIGLVGIDRGLLRQSKGEGSEPGEQVGEALRALRPIPYQSGESGFSLARGLEKGAPRQPHLGAR